jgi:hypothetical protein
MAWFVIVSHEETKTGTAIEFPVPELLESYLAFYLDIIRPRMLRRPNCAALWVSAKGGALVYSAIGQVFSGSRRAASASASPLTTHAMRQQQPGLFSPLVRSVLPATCLRTAICEPLSNTTIGHEASKPVAHIVG